MEGFLQEIESLKKSILNVSHSELYLKDRKLAKLLMGLLKIYCRSEDHDFQKTFEEVVNMVFTLLKIA